MSIAEKIKDIEHELQRTQVNKATMAHICSLRARLVRYKRELAEGASKGSGGPGEGFDVKKLSGSCRVGLVGFPSVGKSSLLSKITSTESYVSEQQFSTLTAIPGTLYLKGSRIQVLDLPGIVEGAATGDKGRGRRVLSAARTSDLLLIVLDAGQPVTTKNVIDQELWSFGMRLNKKPPAIIITKKAGSGGITFRSQYDIDFDISHVKQICTEYKLHNVDISIREPECTLDDLIDAIEGNRTYVPAIYVLNKADSVTIEELDIFDRYLPHSVAVSVKYGWGIDDLLEKIWEYLGMVRIYTKPQGQIPDYSAPVILRTDGSGSNCTILDFCNKIHRSLINDLKYAWVWGSSVNHQPQRVGKDHVLNDEDIVQLVKRI